MAIMSLLSDSDCMPAHVPDLVILLVQIGHSETSIKDIQSVINSLPAKEPGSSEEQVQYNERSLRGAGFDTANRNCTASYATNTIGILESLAKTVS
jgi:hypothetical protein